MPQPFPKSIKEFTINCSYPAKKRQLLAIYAAQIFATWATLEMNLTIMVTALPEGSTNSFAAMFDSIPATRAKVKAIKAVARETLSNREDNDLLDSIFKLYASAAKSRNNLAHHIWGTLDELPKALLIVDPTGINALSRLNQKYSPLGGLKDYGKTGVGFEKNSSPPDSEVQSVTEEYRSSIRVWVENDFIEAQKRLDKTFIAITTFTMILVSGTTSQKAKESRKFLNEILKSK